MFDLPRRRPAAWSGWANRTRRCWPARASRTGCGGCWTARRRRGSWAWSRTSPATRCGRGASTRPTSRRCCSATAPRTRWCRRPRRVVPRRLPNARLEVVPEVGHLVVVPFWGEALTTCSAHEYLTQGRTSGKVRSFAPLLRRMQRPCNLLLRSVWSHQPSDATSVFSGRTTDGQVRGTRRARQRRQLQAPLRQLHRRRVRRAGQGPVLREPDPGHRPDLHRGRPRHRRGHRARAGRRARRRAGLGQDLGRRARQHPEQDRRPDRGQPREDRRRRGWDNGKAGRETLDADIPLAIDHFRYFAGALRAQEGRSRRSTRTPSPTTSTSRSASSGRSSRGTSRS